MYSSFSIAPSPEGSEVSNKMREEQTKNTKKALQQMGYDNYLIEEAMKGKRSKKKKNEILGKTLTSRKKFPVNISLEPAL